MTSARLLSLSPEQFFTLRDGVIEARPMKGTAPRRADPAADAAEAAALAADPKQRAENLMIVDLMRNDLARVARDRAASRCPTCSRSRPIRRSTRWSAGSPPGSGPGSTRSTCCETIFPCGSITGAPKIAAIEALRRLEPEPRGAYTGSMGWIEPGAGDAAFNVLIRTLEWPRGASARAARPRIGACRRQQATR